MADIVISNNGKLRKQEDIELADQVTKLRKKGDVWGVIDLLVEAWVKRAPEESEALKIDIADQQEMMVDKEFGQTMGGKDMDRRLQVIFPMTLDLLIRTQYKAKELPFNAEFYREFAKRYPGFKVAEKV